MSPTAHSSCVPPGTRPDVVHVPAVAAVSLSGCRRQAYAALTRWGLTALGDSVVLLVSELITNALQHGGGCSDFHMIRTETGVLVEVRNASKRCWLNLRQPTVEDERGRGLLLVEEFADDWGVDQDRMIVWFTFSARSGES